MITRLVTIPESNARQRMSAYVTHARDQLTALGANLPFDEPVWDVSAHCGRPAGKAGTASNIYFTTHDNGSAKSIEGRTPMREPFASFIKAVVRHRQEVRRQTHSPLDRIVNAARDLYDVLADRDHDPVLLSREDFDEAARRAVERSSTVTAYRLGCALQIVAEVLDASHLTLTQLSWRNPIRKTTNAKSRTSDHAAQTRADKLPSAEMLDELARISHLVTEPGDIVLMSGIKLLQCAPWRIGEVVTMPEDCEVTEPVLQDDGSPKLGPDGVPLERYGLRYHKLKSKNADVKWIVEPMVPVARKAIADIRAHTSSARSVARWLEDHTGRAWLPGQDLGPEQRYTTTQVATMFGMGDANMGRQWLKQHGIALPGGYRQTVKRGGLEEALLKMQRMVKPDRRKLKTSEHLFLAHHNFYARKATNPCVVTLTSVQHFGDFLGGRKSDHGQTLSIFDEFRRADDVSPAVRMTSHMFRHWLNTMAQRSGVDQVTIARWSGRDDVSQNSEYDHLNGVEMGERVREVIAVGGAHGALAQIHDRKPLADRKSFRNSVIATAHLTDLGLCDLDWTQSECPEYLACEHCEFCLVKKGDQTDRARAVEKRDDNFWLLDRAEAEVDDGTIGASNHVLTLRTTVERLDRIIAIHDDASIPDGTLVQPVSCSGDHFGGGPLAEGACKTRRSRSSANESASPKLSASR